SPACHFRRRRRRGLLRTPTTPTPLDAEGKDSWRFPARSIASPHFRPPSRTWYVICRGILSRERLDRRNLSVTTKSPRGQEIGLRAGHSRGFRRDQATEAGRGVGGVAGFVVVVNDVHFGDQPG